jgi:hypothetical protein
LWSTIDCKLLGERNTTLARDGGGGTALMLLLVLMMDRRGVHQTREPSKGEKEGRFDHFDNEWMEWYNTKWMWDRQRRWKRDLRIFDAHLALQTYILIPSGNEQAPQQLDLLPPGISNAD